MLILAQKQSHKCYIFMQERDVSTEAMHQYVGGFMKIIDEIPGLYKVIQFDIFRKTNKVTFDLIPLELFDHIDSLDRVIHENGAISPGSVADVERPWYMHKFQDDNLVVFDGARYVEIYTPLHGKVEKFTVTPDKVYKDGILIAQGSVLLVWPRNVFHRIVSADTGSASLNIAVHYEGFDIRTNFNVYDLDTTTGKCKIIREGHLDQI